MKLNNNSYPYPETKYYRWFEGALEDIAVALNDGDLADAQAEVWDLWQQQCDKVDEEYAEVVESRPDILNMTTDEAMLAMGERADLIQALCGEMRMIERLSGISYENITAQTMLKCMVRDPHFYNITL